ncbi:N-acetylmannosamine-6-phosphate 2-epimerase [Nitratireductor pacificus pht-3B]|uniref:N-acylglucosamine-6-phosphate 2-epimerase n=2 Tax=Nitratireductor TaxID=245876 RepID=K2MIH1_9HYPH|nr:N-acetylmannosamine-6-phosphate 2-epimerase [Nitratireductor pacificus pht-3B]
MDRPDIVAAMAQAAIAGGAAGVRIEGIEKLKIVRPMIEAPIIGIVKCDLPESSARITVSVASAQALIDAGADIVGYDATPRPRVDERREIVAAILSGGALAMADCSTLEDAIAARKEGAVILGTTLSGYTPDTAAEDAGPDLPLLGKLRELGRFVMAEGRFDTPSLAALAMTAGADAVTVGSALTRLEIATQWFAEAVRSRA